MTEALLWNELGNIYLKLNAPLEAITAYSKALEMDPSFGLATYNLGHAYSLAEEYGTALFLFRKCLPLMTTWENQAMVWNKIGDAYRALKDVDNAMQAYKKANELQLGNPSSSPEKQVHSDHVPQGQDNVAGGNGGGQELSGEFSHLSSLIGRNKAASPFSGETDPARGVAAAGGLKNDPGGLVKKGDFRSNLEKSFIVITGDDKESDTTGEKNESNRGSSLVGGVVEATRKNEPRQEIPEKPAAGQAGIANLEEILAKVNIYENITRVNPNNDRAWDTLGKLYKSLGRYKDAIGAYQKAIEIAPDREVYYYYLGLLYSVEQQHDDAVRAFLFVLRKNPDYVLAHSALAGVYHRMGLENKANHHIATALPKMNNESAYNRACFYAICGDNELAFEFLRLALLNKDTTIEWIKSDPDLDPIRSDARYLELISDSAKQVAENDNYFSSQSGKKPNQLLPILNNSLAR